MKSLYALMLVTTLAIAISPRAPAADEVPEDSKSLETGFDFEIARTDFRDRVIDWLHDRNTTVAWVSDFVLPGSELPLHLDVDPGDKEVVLEWKLRFR